MSQSSTQHVQSSIHLCDAAWNASQTCQLILPLHFHSFFCGRKAESRTIPNLWLMHFKRHSTIRMLGLDTASFSATVVFSTIPAIECVHKHRYKLCSLTITNVEILRYKTQQMGYVYRLLPMSYTNYAKGRFTHSMPCPCRSPAMP